MWNIHSNQNVSSSLMKEKKQGWKLEKNRHRLIIHKQLIEGCNSTKKRKMLIVLDDMIADMLSKK